MREKKPTLNHRAGYGARRSRAVPRRSNRSLRGQYRRGCHVLWYVFTDRKKTDLRPTGEEYYHNYNYYFIMFVTGDFHVTTHSGWPRCGRGARRDFHVRACVPVAEVTRATTGPIDDARSSRPRHSRKGGEKQKTKRKKKKKGEKPARTIAKNIHHETGGGVTRNVAAIGFSIDPNENDRSDTKKIRPRGGR